MGDRLRRGVIATIFATSGACGLVYEVLWTRQLALIFGITTYAVATVMATFMGGLALGSMLLGAWVDRRRHPLLAYAALEAGIGLTALLVPPLFHALRGPYIALRALDLPPGGLIVGRAALAALVLLPPTILMGGTFPVLVRFWVRTRGALGTGTGVLYAANTAGAIAGCLLAGFVLIGRLGLAGTTYVAAATNLLLAAAAALLAPRTAADVPPASATSPVEVPAGPTSPAIARIVLVAIGVSGFCSLAYEVLWSRALLRYLYNSTYAFTTMLATFLAGIAVGSALYAAVLARVRRPLLVLAALEALIGLGFVGSTHLFPDLMHAFGIGGVHSFRQAVFVMFVRATLVLFLPTLFLGATVPVATELCARSLDTLGRGVGRVYGVNTLGAILGSLAAGFVLIPLCGMQLTLALLVATNLTLAAVLFAAALPAYRRSFFVLMMAAVLFAPRMLPPAVFIRTFPNAGQHLVFYEEGATDTVGVVEARGQRAILYEDRRGTAGTGSYPGNFFLGHLPMLLHPRGARTVCHICFGVGNSLSAVVAHASLGRVDNVELSPHVVAAAPYFWTNNKVLDDPRVRTVIDDGRNHLMASRETYDVILLEPPETLTAGVINLYTEEFYRDALARLAPDGLMTQWIPAGEAPLDDERRLFRAFANVFPHAVAWHQLDTASVLLIGSREPLTVDYARLRERMAEPKVREDLALIGVQDVDHFLSFFLFDEPAFADFVRDVPTVTDDRTVLDFTIPYSLGSGFGLGMFTDQAVEQQGKDPFSIAAERLRYYEMHRRSVVPTLVGLGDESRAAIAARIAAYPPRQMPHPFYAEADWPRRR